MSPVRGEADSPRQARKIRLGAIAVVLIVLVGACGGDNLGADAELTVYVSLPLRGPSGADGRDAMRGTKLALADADNKAGDLAVRAEYLDDTSGRGDGARWDPVQVAENARTATRDSTTIAYVGDFESGATRTSLPITNSARLLHVSPASSAVDLVAPFSGSEEVPEDVQTSGDRTFGRVIPDDEAVADAKRASESGVVLATQAPSQLPAAGQTFVSQYERRFGDEPGPYAAYGYEGMAVVLDSIERASDGTDRQAVVEAFFETENRNSILGTYSVDEVGNTTLERFGRPSA